MTASDYVPTYPDLLLASEGASTDAYRLPQVLPHGAVMPGEPPPDHSLDLIQDLFLEAGRIMEDTSADLALTLPPDLTEITARVDQLHQAATAILALAEAVHALVRQAG